MTSKKTCLQLADQSLTLNDLEQKLKDVTNLEEIEELNISGNKLKLTELSRHVLKRFPNIRVLKLKKNEPLEIVSF
jgi:hypothetical protein